MASGEQLIKQEGFQGSLDALIGTTDGTKAAVAGLFPNIRSLGGALALTGQNTKAANQDLKNFADTSGATADAFAEQQKSISVAWDQIRASIEAAAISVGAKAAPAVAKFFQEMRTGKGQGGDFAKTMTDIGRAMADVFEVMGKVLVPFAKFVGEHPALLKVAAGVVAVGLAVKTIKFASAITGVTDLLGGLRRLGQTKAGQRASESIVLGLSGLWGKIRGVLPGR